MLELMCFFISIFQYTSFFRTVFYNKVNFFKLIICLELFDIIILHLNFKLFSNRILDDFRHVSIVIFSFGTNRRYSVIYLVL